MTFAFIDRLINAHWMKMYFIEDKYFWNDTYVRMSHWT